MPQISAIFQGTTFAPARAFLSELVRTTKPDRAVLPCIGSFLVAATMIEAGIPARQVHTSDITLYSSLLGALFDPDQDPRQLPIDVEGTPAEDFIAGAASPIEFVSGMLVYIKYSQLKDKTAFDRNIRLEILTNRRDYGAQVRKRLEKLQSACNGLHYAPADVRDVLDAEQDNERALIYFNLPGYNGGFSDQFGAAEEALHWQNGVDVREFDPKQTPQLIASLKDAPAHIVTYLHQTSTVTGNRIELLPEGWHILSASQRTPERVDYIVSNRPAQVAVFGNFGKTARAPYPIYNDEEITPASVIDFVQVDRDTALYYRDLFVHKLGVTGAEHFFLMTIDGRVTTSCGLIGRDVRTGHGKSKDYMGEVFGISKSSDRYARLGKLFMLCLTSGDMLRKLLAIYPVYHFRTPRGIQTSSLTTHEEGKTDRSVLKLVSREQQPNGQFLLVYRGDFREDTWADVLKLWIDRWGHKQRTTTQPAPQVPEAIT